MVNAKIWILYGSIYSTILAFGFSGSFSSFVALAQLARSLIPKKKQKKIDTRKQAEEFLWTTAYTMDERTSERTGTSWKKGGGRESENNHNNKNGSLHHHRHHQHRCVSTLGSTSISLWIFSISSSQPGFYFSLTFFFVYFFFDLLLLATVLIQQMSLFTNAELHKIMENLFLMHNAGAFLPPSSCHSWSSCFTLLFLLFEVK